MAIQSQAGAVGLNRFAQLARTARTPAEVVNAVIVCCDEIIGAAVVACYRGTAAAFEIDQIAAPDVLALRYGEFVATAADPVHAALAAGRVVVRSSDLFTPEEWQGHPFHRNVESGFGLEAYMAAELLDRTGPWGVVGVARRTGSPAFSSLDALRLQAVSLHASVALTRIGCAGTCESFATLTLTDRQRELVKLIANGLTTEQIAGALGITSHAVKKAIERMFAKVEVSSRAELVARLGVQALTSEQ